jgi:hypothetical protein
MNEGKTFNHETVLTSDVTHSVNKNIFHFEDVSKCIYLVTPNCILKAHPNVAQATPSGIRKANGPRTRSPNVTATALAVVISGMDSTVMYAMFIKTYSPVTIGTLIAILLGMFLQRKKQVKCS